MEQSEISIFFEQTGLQTTLQDLGRIGYQHLGVAAGGALDRKSAELANQLVGNLPDAPVLEITLLGPKLRIEGDCQIALTGADLSPKLNQKPLLMYQTLTLREQNVLTFGKPMLGCRAYLAIGGEWQAKKWLGSYSAATQYAHLLTPESIFEKHSHLKVLPSTPLPAALDFSLQAISEDALQKPLRVIPAPEFEQFSQEDIARFFSQSYQVSLQSNRMGYRLVPNRYKLQQADFPIISSGIVAGTVQIVPEGTPIMLLADAQTTGGYPRIVNIIDDDLDRVAQYKPYDWVRFELFDG